MGFLGAGTIIKSADGGLTGLTTATTIEDRTEERPLLKPYMEQLCATLLQGCRRLRRNQLRPLRERAAEKS